jgi:hypothetical protein
MPTSSEASNAFCLTRSRRSPSLPTGASETSISTTCFGPNCGFDYIIRFRKCIRFRDESGEAQRAGDWVPSNGPRCFCLMPV